MIREKLDKIINEIKDELKGKYPDFNGIYLFGSQARGDASIDSDYDIAITSHYNLKWQIKDKMISSIYEYILKYDIIIEPHFLTEEDLINPKTPLNYQISKEGIYYGF